MTDPHILVTGGAGFIGSHLVDLLLSKYKKITVMDIDEEQGKKLPKEVNFVKGDVTNPNEWKFKDIDILIHLAAEAYPKACETNPEASFRTNVQGTFNALQFALRNKVKKVIFVSSAQLYGRSPEYFPIDEKHPIDIEENNYCMTKGIGEILCNQFSSQYNVPVLYFRFFNVYGPGQKTHYFIPTIITQAIQNNVIELWTGKPTRDFIYVTDVAAALMAGAESSYCGGPINIGTGVEIKTGDAAKKMADILEMEVKFLDKDIIGCMRMCCDNRKAKSVLGWKPKVNFDDGIKQTIDWYKDNHKN